MPVNLLSPTTATADVAPIPLQTKPSSGPLAPFSIMQASGGEAIKIEKAVLSIPVNYPFLNTTCAISLGVCTFSSDAATFAANFAASGVKFFDDHFAVAGDTIPLGDWLEGFWLAEFDCLCGWWYGRTDIFTKAPVLMISTTIFS